MLLLSGEIVGGEGAEKMGLSANAMLNATEVLPVGYQFRPTEDELLLHYLWRKNAGDGEEDIIYIIPEFDVYQCEPEELPAIFSESSIIQAKDQEWWFFCEQNIKGKTHNRSTKGGHWNKTGKTRVVKSRSSEEVIGSKNVLTFRRGSSSKYTNTGWVMHEYHLAINISDGLARDSRENYVLCKIKCKSYQNTSSCLSREFGREETTTMIIDHSGLADMEPDNVLIPEELIQSTARLLEQELISEPLPESLRSSANSSHMPCSVTGSSTNMHSPFSHVYSQIFGDWDQHYNGTGIGTSQGGEVFSLQADWFQEGEEPMMMHNKWTSEVESFHGYALIDEKKGVIEHDWDKSTYPSVCVITREQPTAQKQSQAEIEEDNASENGSGESSGSSSLSASPPPEDTKKDTSSAIVPYVPASTENKIKGEITSRDDIDESAASSVRHVGTPREDTGIETSNAIIPNVLSTEADAWKYTSTTIKEEINAASRSSSSIAIHKPKQAAGYSKRHTNPANSIKTEGIAFVIANNNAARRNKSIDVGTTVFTTSSRHRRKCCHNEQSFDAVLALKLLAVLCLTMVILHGIDSLRYISYGC